MVDVGGIARERLQSFVERIENLEEEKCECSDGWERSFMEIYSYVVIVLHAIIIILKMILIFMIFKMLNKLPNRERKKIKLFKKRRK